MFPPDYTCPMVLFPGDLLKISPTGLSPSMGLLSRSFGYLLQILVLCWAVPLSLAATQGIEVSFFSLRYLDVSVPALSLPAAMNLLQDT